MVLFEEKNKKGKKEEEIKDYIFDENNLKKTRDHRQAKPKVKSSIADIIPVIDVTANGYFELRNNEGFFEIVQLTSKDIYSLNKSDKENDIYSLAYMFQAYNHSVKLVPLNFPVNTEQQKNYISKRIAKCKNPLYIPFLEKKLAELDFLEQQRTNREYLLFIYADSEYNLRERVHQVTRLLQRSNPVITLSEDKKTKVLYKLYNQNSKTKTL